MNRQGTYLRRQIKGRQSSELSLVSCSILRVSIRSAVKVSRLFEDMPEDRARLLEEQFELRTVRSVPKLRYALFARRISDRAAAPGHESTE